MKQYCCCSFFFFTAPAAPEIYTLSLHDALPISRASPVGTALPAGCRCPAWAGSRCRRQPASSSLTRSEEHTSELQSQFHLVCRLLLEKKKFTITTPSPSKNALIPLSSLITHLNP